jgi:hypothetical protein
LLSGNFGIATGAFVDERDDWAAAAGRAAREGWAAIELTALTEERFAALELFLKGDEDAFSGFERVSIHAPTAFRESSAADVVAALCAGTADSDVILHPDVYSGEGSVVKLGARAVFENMDCQKTFGRDVDDLRIVFDRFANAGFCLDVAHCRTNDETLALAHELLDAFGERLRQVHVSGIEPDGTHRPTTSADLDSYAGVLNRCTAVPWLLEAELVA